MGNPYSTAGDLVNRAAVQVGLAKTSDPYESTDPNFVMLQEFMACAGDDLCREHDWTHLRQEYSFTTVGGVSVYPLPADFREMVDQTGWNRSTFLPVSGPLTSQQWQFIKSRAMGVVYNVLFRLKDQELELIASNIPAGQTISLEYVSTSWTRDAASVAVDSAGVPVATKGAPTQSGDLVLFDPLLIVRYLKVQWLQARGFDTAVARREYEDVLANQIGKNQGSAILSLNRRSRVGDRLLDGAGNLPITGYGS